MALIILGALLMIVGVALAAVKSAGRGRLSKPPDTTDDESRDTLEPRGPGKRLSIKADLPGIALLVVGGILIFAGAAGYA
ncbi:hypothetical protein GCM10011494_38220 [Novosphingobium endophyticum]|uniref:Uncharacterized protein n=1 Tax=Novosphingobium endophyticum TaxID=1955250 RepID=A0A916X691_9SPHN|nr:hypothetical protein [Novosphingobium endophyticum]GGC15684.1 hypothetical protein GCM10011494_38220 [Novosphingobium endophyticum]